MTPEQQFRRLKRRGRWTVNEVSPREGVFVRTSRRLNIGGMIATTVAVATAVVLIGGAVVFTQHRDQQPAPPVTPTSIPTETSTPSPTLSPTTTPTPDTGALARPTPSIDVACDDLADPTELSAFMGVDVLPSDPLASYLRGGWAIPVISATFTEGGLECEWGNGAPDNGNTGENDEFQGVQIAFLPGAETLIDDLGYDPENSACVSDQCSATALVGSTVVTIEATGVEAMGRSRAEREEQFRPIVDSVLATLSAAGDGPMLAEHTTMTTRCDEFITNAQWTDAAGAPMLEAGTDGGGGFSVAELAYWRIDPRLCAWGAEEGTFDWMFAMRRLGDSGWMVPAYASAESPQGPSVPLSIPGTQAAQARCEPHAKTDYYVVCVIDVAIDGDWYQLSAFPESSSLDREPIEILTKAVAALVANLS
jgi:hypothetical protein